ncbi:MAG: nucleotide exchange factor GrpE [Mycobacteriales bacterium]
MSPDRSRKDETDRRHEDEPEQPRVVVRDKRRIDPVTGAVRTPPSAGPGSAAASGPGGSSAGAAGPGGDSATWTASSSPGPGESPEVAELSQQLGERTADLQRLSAEYANYRKRVDRDRVLLTDAATAAVVTSFLPVLDDIDRAREHGDVTGAFKATADQLDGVFGKLGLTTYGEVGDEFDPHVHEAVLHQTGPDVTVPTCTQVMRRGYRLHEQVLRHAMVGVTGPADPSGGE